MTEIINIITRTHNRKDYFEVCKKSVLSQTAIDRVNWIVGSDVECNYYPEAIRLFTDIRVPVGIPAGMYHAPWNLHLDTLQQEVRSGYVCYLDDDDMFTNEKSVMRILNAVEEDKLLVWKVQITPQWIVPTTSFAHYIKAGDFSGIGMAFHSKHLPVTWGNISYGDYRVAWQLQQKGLKIKWLDMVLTKTQKGANNGK